MQRRRSAFDVGRVRKGFTGPVELTRLLRKDRRARVVFGGKLLGPQPLAPDNPLLPATMSLPDRMRAQRFGHQNAFRTEFMVDQVALPYSITVTAPPYKW
jgi:hypothetical protein